jgi:hypothetical protein
VLRRANTQLVKADSRSDNSAKESSNNWITTSVITKNPFSLEALCQLEYLVMILPFFVPTTPSVTTGQSVFF